MRIIRLIPSALLLLVVACSQPAPPAPAPAAPKPDLAAEEKAIRAMDARWLKAAMARDGAGEAASFASDGTAYREHLQPIAGPAAYQAYATKFYADNPKANVTWSTDAIHVAESGELAVQVGESRTTGLGAKGEGEDRTRFVTVWKKVGGEWKVAYDIGSTTMPETVKKD
jgi:uncharacterized protein (TIGR02246 family)